VALVHVDLATGTASLPTRAGGDSGPIEALLVLLDAVTGPVDPADAPLAIVTGRVAGARGPGLARTTAVGLSPLSGAVAETRAEGPYAAGMRASGVTGVVLSGRAATPSCVVIEDGSARVEPAGDVWGLDTREATDRMRERYGEHAAVAVIGPAGENGVRYASVVTCYDHPLPRLGFGAVLGAKRVKAVVCRTGASPAVADPVALRVIADRYAVAIPDNQLAAWQQGVPGFAVWGADPGYATVTNFADTRSRSGVEPAMAPPLERVAACPGCPTDCVKVYAGAGLHQETLAMLGTNLGFDDPWQLHTRCLALGLDPVSLGGTLAAAGTAPADIRAVIEAIGAGRDTSGLGEGAARLAASGRAVNPAMTSKRVELPPFDPRVQPNLGLGLAVAPIGPRYDIVEHDLDFVDGGLTYSFEEVRRLGVSVPRKLGVLDPFGTARLMELWSGLDALGVCLFAATPTRPLTLADVEDLAEAVVGARPDVLALGRRRLWLQREVNRRLGIGLDQDTLPSHFFTEPVAAGPWVGAVLDPIAFRAATAELHQLLGFTPDASHDIEES
jgi:aldehyde:ferredoxin oxidoreductase